MTPFSVLISIYHKERPEWFDEAMASLFAQTLLPSEIVLVKDGPLTPELEAIIDKYQAKYPIFNIVTNPTNLGLGLALARGVEAASNEIIARMDTDDVIPADRFEKQIAKIEEGYDVVSCWSLIYEGSIDNIIATKTLPEHSDNIITLAHKRSPICHAGSVFRKSSVLKAGNYLHALYYEDYYLWIRMILDGCKFYNIQEVLYYIRTSQDQIKRRGGWNYLMNELKIFKLFHKIGFYTAKDLLVNSFIRICVRLTPTSLRKLAMKIVWNKKTSV